MSFAFFLSASTASVLKAEWRKLLHVGKVFASVQSPLRPEMEVLGLIV